MCCLQRFAALDENAIGRANAGADHDGSWRGETESAWARDAEHGDGKLESILINCFVLRTTPFLHRKTENTAD